MKKQSFSPGRSALAAAAALELNSAAIAIAPDHGHVAGSCRRNC